MGVLNDNIFKLTTAYLLIDILGPDHASTIMAVCGAVFVIPFLLFSSTAGHVADRFSKQRLMMLMKVIEMIIMILAMIAFALKSVWASYSLLFVLATHSALFGPSKYAIISELVPKDKVSSANGLITSFTYFGIIIGTFLASFLAQMTGRNFVFVAAWGLLIAVVGFIATFGIKPTGSQKTDIKLNGFFLQQIIATLRFCKTRKHLLVAMSGSAYFLFLGAFTQLNMIPFAMSSLNMTDIAGGYLFLCTAVGIAIGAFIGGRASKKRVELGLSCFAALIISILLFFLTLCCQDLLSVVTLLFFLGIFGGLFIVPFDSYVQLYSPDEKRGEVIGANNFLSFCGVLVASLVLFLFSDVFGIAPAAGFGIIGIVTLFLGLLMISRLSDLALPFIARRFVKPFADLKVENIELLEKNPNAILILPEATWAKAFLLLSIGPNIHLLLRKKAKRRFPWFHWTFYSVHLVPSDDTYRALLDAGKGLSSEGINACIMIDEKELPETFKQRSKLLSIFQAEQPLFLYVDIKFSSSAVILSFKKQIG